MATVVLEGDGSLFERIYHVERIVAGGLRDRVEASPEERSRIADTLDLQAFASLSFAFELKPLSRGRLSLNGRVEGVATQSCVVSLEPVDQTVNEAVALEFWPVEETAEARGEVEVTPDAPEPYSGGTVDLGQIAYEVFAAALDPYPRRPGAEFAWSGTGPEEGAGESGPFAALKRLKGS